MTANRVLTRTGVAGGYKREESFVGTPEQCCAVCVHWRKETSEFAGPGEGPCKKDKGARTWGLALCADFLRNTKAGKS